MATLKDLVGISLGELSNQELFIFTRALRERRRLAPTIKPSKKPTEKKSIDVSTLLNKMSDLEKLKLLELIGGQDDN
jgi:hypothetical protein